MWKQHFPFKSIPSTNYSRVRNKLTHRKQHYRTSSTFYNSKRELMISLWKPPAIQVTKFPVYWA